MIERLCLNCILSSKTPRLFRELPQFVLSAQTGAVQYESGVLIWALTYWHSLGNFTIPYSIYVARVLKFSCAASLFLLDYLEIKTNQ